MSSKRKDLPVRRSGERSGIEVGSGDAPATLAAPPGPERGREGHLASRVGADAARVGEPDPAVPDRAPEDGTLTAERSEPYKVVERGDAAGGEDGKAGCVDHA